MVDKYYVEYACKRLMDGKSITLTEEALNLVATELILTKGPVLITRTPVDIQQEISLWGTEILPERAINREALADLELWDVTVKYAPPSIYPYDKTKSITTIAQKLREIAEAIGEDDPDYEDDDFVAAELKEVVNDLRTLTYHCMGRRI